MVTGVLSARVEIDARVFKLINRTATILADASLDESLAALLTRLIDRPERLLIVRKAESTPGLVAELEPFAELLLYEIQDLARRSGDSATKARWIDRALSLGGV